MTIYPGRGHATLPDSPSTRQTRSAGIPERRVVAALRHTTASRRCCGHATPGRQVSTHSSPSTLSIADIEKTGRRGKRGQTETQLRSNRSTRPRCVASKTDRPSARQVAVLQVSSRPSFAERLRLPRTNPAPSTIGLSGRCGPREHGGRRACTTATRRGDRTTKLRYGDHDAIGGELRHQASQ